MKKLKPSWSLALGIAFGVMIFCSSFCQSFKPGAVCTAIPDRTTFFFKADSLEQLLQSPVCRQIDKALGAGNTLRDLAENSSWTDLVAASEIAVADIPFRYAGEQKTWAAVSWVGWRSPWLRWRLEHCRDKNLQLMGKHAVWPIWLYESDEIARGMRLTFALTDNVFIACISESPLDIILLLDTYDGRSPAVKPQLNGKTL
jgi:hypothetical protein